MGVLAFDFFVGVLGFDCFFGVLAVSSVPSVDLERFRLEGVFFVSTGFMRKSMKSDIVVLVIGSPSCLKVAFRSVAFNRLWNYMGDKQSVGVRIDD